MQQSNYDIYIIAITGSLLFAFLGGFLVLFVVLYQQRQKQFAREKEQLILTMKLKSTQSELEISENMMKKISLEIHDNVGQLLSVARFQLTNALKENESESLYTASELVGRALTDLRDLSRSLNGRFISEMGLVAAVEREVNMISAGGRIRCELNIEERYPKIVPEQQIVIFRCVQELISNVIKHAKATVIKVEILNTQNTLIVLVADNGMGIKATGSKGLGVQSIYERMQSLGGEAEFQSAPAGGTEVRLKLKMKEN